MPRLEQRTCLAYSPLKPGAGKRVLMSAIIHFPEVFLCHRCILAVLVRHVARHFVNLHTEIANRIFQVGEGTRHKDRLVHNLPPVCSSEDVWPIPARKLSMSATAEQHQPRYSHLKP